MISKYRVFIVENKGILLLTLTAVLAFVLYGCRNGGNFVEEKAKMEQHLKEKFGKDFVVKSIKYYREQLGGDKRIRAVVHPADDSELEFEVLKLLGDSKWAFKNSQYTDDYLYTLWKKQMTKKVIQEFETEIAEVGISAPILEIEKNLNGKTLDIDEAIELYGKNITINIRCGYFVGGDLQQLDSDRLEKLYSAILTVKDFNVSKVGLLARYFNEERKKGIEKNSAKYLRAEASDYRDLKNNNTILFSIEIEDIKKINQLGDLQDFVEK